MRLIDSDGTGLGSDYNQYLVYGVLTQTNANPTGLYTDLVTATVNFQ